MHASKTIFILTPLCALLATGSAHATNGMLMEGYGPISTGMGGASQAIDHGNAAMAQNPATLGFIADGTARLDVAIGILGPDVKSSMMGMDAKSSGTTYLMPAFGYTRRSGATTYGIGMFAQGGMGTEYEATSFLAMGSGAPVRSELGVGNLIVPVAYHLNWKYQIKSWDRFQVPLPFAVCEITVGRPLRVPREATSPEREALRQQLENALRSITRD